MKKIHVGKQVIGKKGEEVERKRGRQKTKEGGKEEEERRREIGSRRGRKRKIEREK